MTSERKIRANRANSRASTGPKTAHGRARVARNALRHALSLPDPFRSSFVRRGGGAGAGNYREGCQCRKKELARRIAEAQIDLRRVRHARHQLFSETLSDPDYESEAMQRKKLAAGTSAVCGAMTRAYAQCRRT